jgi:hypothetical protein
MINRVVRAIVTLGATALLAACSGVSNTPPVMQLTTPSSVLAGGAGNLVSALTSSQSSACAVTNGWHFHGSCKTIVLPYSGKTVTLPAYHGMTVKITIGQNGFGTKLVLGLGTSDTDITGKQFNTAFPVWGSKAATCVGGGGLSERCKGKGFLYILFYEPSSSLGGGIPNYPSYRITNTGSFYGTHCVESTIDWNTKWYWIDSPVTAKPVNGVATFKASPDWGLTLTPGEFSVVAFHCS